MNLRYSFRAARSCSSTGLTAAFLVCSLFAGELWGQRVPVGGANANASVDNSSVSWHLQYSLYEYLFNQRGLETVQDPSEAFTNPETTAIVALGRQRVDRLLEQLAPVVGVSPILIATDYGGAAPGYFQIASGPVTARTREIRYLEHRDCLRLNTFPASDPLTGGLREVVINRGSWLAKLDERLGRWTVHGRYPIEVSPAESAFAAFIATWRSRDLSKPAPMTVVSDQSLFSNGMLWHGQNMLVALNTIGTFSVEGCERVLFIVDGLPKTTPGAIVPPVMDMNVPKPEIEELPIDPSLQSLLEMSNAVITKFEDADLMNEMLANQPRRIREAYYRRILIVGFSALLFAAALYQFSRQFQRPRATVPLEVETAGDNDWVDGPDSPEDRGRAAQYLIRGALSEWTGSSDPVVWRRSLELSVPGSVDDGGTIAIAHLLHLGTANPVPPLSREKLHSVGLEVLRFRAQLRNKDSVLPSAIG